MDWSRLYVRLLWAYEGAPQGMHHALPEAAQSIMCWFIQRGEVEAEGAKSGLVRGHAGQWLFLANDKVRHDFTDDARIVSLRLIVRWPGGQPLYPNDQWIKFDSANSPLLERHTRSLLRRLRPYLSRARDLTHLMAEPARLVDYIRIEQATLQWLVVYDSVMQSLGVQPTPVSRMDDRVGRAVELLDRQDLGDPADEREIATLVGLSIGQLNRLFTSQVGMTVKAYAEQRRIDHVRRTLLSSTMPIKQLAYTMGFRQQSHFSRWFHKKTGIYPRAFREKTHHPNELIR